jgi:hypothetical protein
MRLVDGWLKKGLVTNSMADYSILGDSLQFNHVSRAAMK